MKKSFNKTTLLLLTLSAIYIVCSAHFIWTETSSVATLGKEQQINLFFGEINFDKKEVAGGRLDEMEGLKTLYITPKDERKELQLTKQKDRFTTSFTPDEPGVYQVLTTNTNAKVMDLRNSGLGIVKPMFYAREIVLCPDKKNSDILKSSTLKPYFDLDLIPDYSNSRQNIFPVNKPLNFTSFFKKNPVKGGKIFAYAPNGWAKEIDADDKGICTFTPLWEGQYVIDWVYPENAPGTYQGKDYEMVRHRAVLTINVGK